MLLATYACEKSIFANSFIKKNLCIVSRPAYCKFNEMKMQKTKTQRKVIKTKEQKKQKIVEKCEKKIIS